MISRSRKIVLLNILIIAGLALAACQGAQPQVIESTRIVTQEVPVTQEVIRTVEVEVEVPMEVMVTPTAEMVDRNGGWLDMIVAVEEPSAESAVSRIDSGELDVFAFTLSDPDLLAQVEASPQMDHITAYGSSFDLTINTAGPVFSGSGELNPFALPEVREALNWLIDRSYIAQEIMGGLGQPRFFPLTTIFPDYIRYIDVARRLEAEYGYNPERAEAAISAAMEGLGAERVDGIWTYEGDPVEIQFLIRSEDERREIGEYIANQLESIGFTVRRDIKTSAEAAPLWVGSDPNDGLWHLYTGGWINTQVLRDQGLNFDYYYTPRGLPYPLWQIYAPSPEFDAVADRLARNDFSSMEERGQLFAQAMEYSLKESMRLFLVDQVFISPMRSDVSVTADLAAGIHGSQLWPFTLRRTDEVGGALTFSSVSIMTEPWNPVAGSNQVYDQMLINATQDVSLMNDPYTGLYWPQRLESAEVYVREGLPVEKTLDWLTLEFAPEDFEVPEDAWVDWDATEQRFITAGEQSPEGLTSVTKIVYHYPESLYDIQWHDGSTLDLGDIIMAFIMIMDQAKEDSPIYDEAAVAFYEGTFAPAFKGMRIVQEDPLVVEWYSDLIQLDAERMVFNNELFPTYLFGPGAWHSVGLGVLAEMNQELAFSASKAEALEVEQMSYIGGPSLDILSTYLEQAAAENYIPFANTLSQYITPEEAQERWANYQSWFNRTGHFWLGTGPYYLDRAFPVEGTLILRHNANYPDPATKWSQFTEPRVAEVEVDGPGRVDSGTEAVFDVFVTYQGEPYPSEDIQDVRYVVFDASGQVAFSGLAENSGEGQYQITLTPEQIDELDSGTHRMEVVVSPSVVSLATFVPVEFVTIGN